MVSPDYPKTENLRTQARGSYTSRFMAVSRAPRSGQTGFWNESKEPQRVLESSQASTLLDEAAGRRFGVEVHLIDQLTDGVDFARRSV
jgi:hypothetical protein